MRIILLLAEIPAHGKLHIRVFLSLLSLPEFLVKVSPGSNPLKSFHDAGAKKLRYGGLQHTKRDAALEHQSAIGVRLCRLRGLIEVGNVLDRC
jgi:hypothetical protein